MPEAVLTLRSPSERLCSLAYSPDGQRLVTGGIDGQLTLWDAESGEEIRTAHGPFGGEVWGVTFDPDGKWFASAGADCAVRVWDATTLAPIQTFRGHLGPIRCLAVSRDGKLLVTGSADKTLKVWDVGRIIKSP